MSVRFYSSIAQQTTLIGTITPSATSITVAAVTGFPSNTPFTLSLDYQSATEELVEVTNLAGTTMTITRAIDGTSATTHSSGAVVRHVSSARDFADSRAHENATTGIHGLTPGSALVGTIDTQTLTNKTLTNPTINAATLTGTLAGSPTFSGSPTFNGVTNFNNTALFTNASPLVVRALATDVAFRTSVSGDAVNRYMVTAGGATSWSTGALAADTNLYRAAPDLLATDDKLRTGMGLDIQTTTADQIQFKAATTTTGSIAVRVRDGSNNSLLTINDNGTVFTEGNLVTDGEVNAQTPLIVSGVDQGFGFTEFKLSAQVVLNNANETTLMTTLNPVLFKNNRAYKFSIWGYCNTNVASYFYLRLRKGVGTGGTVYIDQMRIPTLASSSGNVPVSLTPIMSNTSGSDITTSVTLTGQVVSGAVPGQWSSNGGSVNGYLLIEDVGHALDYQGASIT